METKQSPLKVRRKAVLKRLSIWTLCWVLTEALVVFGHNTLWEGSRALTIIGVVINLIFGIGMVFTYRNLMGLLDELERKIQLESMGLTLGLTLVVGIAYSVMDITNLIPVDAEIGMLVFFMGFCYIACMLINKRRYQ
ncbi:hypothetical protein OZ410_02915 [Robiginitalea sp. M366]|uniref:hypothetical protein n=1 Tax=Robiginitalea aestuariiviva TaxID=3036903 RepID=UPI00240D5284|nr:hypothetical protein [Robiginitalea aestuariiviva]MDG1571249.1 hypothetical protein [Robiginitalea aestuariiviva]